MNEYHTLCGNSPIYRKPSTLLDECDGLEYMYVTMHVFLL